MATEGNVVFDIDNQTATVNFVANGVDLETWHYAASQVTVEAIPVERTVDMAEAELAHHRICEWANIITQHHRRGWVVEPGLQSDHRQVLRQLSGRVGLRLEIGGTVYIDAVWNSSTDAVTIDARPAADFSWVDFGMYLDGWRDFYREITRFKAG